MFKCCCVVYCCCVVISSTSFPEHSPLFLSWNAPPSGFTCLSLSQPYLSYIRWHSSQGVLLILIFLVKAAFFMSPPHWPQPHCPLCLGLVHYVIVTNYTKDLVFKPVDGPLAVKCKLLKGETFFSSFSTMNFQSPNRLLIH